MLCVDNAEERDDGYFQVVERRIVVPNAVGSIDPPVRRARRSLRRGPITDPPRACQRSDGMNHAGSSPQIPFPASRRRRHHQRQQPAIAPIPRLRFRVFPSRFATGESCREGPRSRTGSTDHLKFCERKAIHPRRMRGHIPNSEQKAKYANLPLWPAARSPRRF